MKALQDVSFKNVVILSILIRIILIFYSEWHDQHAVVKYTDIDYRVFSDATRFMFKPGTDLLGNLMAENRANGPLGHLFPLGEYVVRGALDIC